MPCSSEPRSIALHRRYHVYRQNGHPRNRQRPPPPAPPIAQLLSLLPVILLFLAMTFNSMSSEPVFSLDQDHVHSHLVLTHRYKVPFFVKNIPKFDKDYPINTHKRYVRL